MPPKIMITKEKILKASLEIVRRKGVEQLNARSVAKELGCSTQPIFSNYKSMQELKRDLIVTAKSIYAEYMKQRISEEKVPYKASGIAYIRFAREERNLFKFLYMRDRQQEALTESKQDVQDLLSILEKNTGMTEDEAYFFHIKMWIFAHGIATMVATNYLKWDEETISKLLTSEYQSCLENYKNNQESINQ